MCNVNGDVWSEVQWQVCVSFNTEMTKTNDSLQVAQCAQIKAYNAQNTV